MAGEVLGKAYALGIGLCLVREAESPGYLVLTSEDTGREYHRARKNVEWRRTATREKEVA